MSGLLKWIGMAILVICIGIWVITVAKSCKQISDPTLENVIPDDIGASVGDALDDVKEGTSDLYEKGAEEMSELKKEAIEAKDKIAMKAEDLSSKVFEEDPEDLDLEENDDEASARDAIAARRDQLTEKGGSSSSDNTRSSNRSSSSASSSTGKYFVVTGSFLEEANANEMVKQLKKAGYHNAEVAVFDLSQYYTVFARRYNTHNSASELAESISQKLGIETYVHEKRKGRNR